jgi:signal transduction histidine kinase/CheY-like chemotaxis protein
MAAASIAVAAAAGYFMRTIETDYLRDELRRESLTAAQTLSTGMSLVRTGDGSYELGKLAALARHGDTRIYSLALVDGDGRTITRWVSTSDAALDEVIYFRVPARIPARPDSQLIVSWNVAAQIGRVEQHVERIRSNVFVAIALLSGLLVLLMHFLVVRPVGTLREGLDRLARGGSSAVLSLSRFAAAELARLGQSVRELGRYQHELRDAQESLVDAHRRAELASEAKGRFLAVMSHEIRTPINGVVGNLELLDDAQLSTAQHALVSNAQRSADSLLEIINEILDFSRIESGRLQLENTELQLEAQLNDVASSISSLLNPAAVELVVDFDPALPGKIIGDPLRLRQVLTNLLGNAAKFTAAGHIVLQATLEPDRHLQLSVRDSGIGIDAQQQRLLFEPFTQADSSISRHYGGTGLGLSISKQLVELMGGQISVESEPGHGSVFRVQLPLIECAPPRQFATPADALGDTAGDACNRVVLLVSNSNARDALSRYVRGMGLTPLCADDEQGARAHVRDAGRNLYALVVDSVVVAAQLPALVMRLRDAMALRDVKVILLLPAGVAVAQDMVFDAMVLKPVKRGELYAALIGTQSLPDADSAGRVAGIDGSREAARGQVLLVDDNPMNVQVAQSMLQRLSLAVDTANSGEQALQCLADHAYDVVLMDEQMPGMDGLETTRLLRERERRDEGEQRHTIVVALTANADSEAQQRCLAAGMDGFLAKPVRRKALRAMLAGWIANLPVDDG